MNTMRPERSSCLLIATLLVSALVVPRPVLAGQQGDEAKGATVLAEARKALGGEDKLAAVKRLQVTGTSKRANGNFNLEGDTEVFFELPDKFRRNESLTLGAGGSGIERVEILNGTEVTNETSGGGDFAGRFGRGRFGGGFPGGGAPGAGAPGAGAPDGRGGAPADGRAAQTPADQERLREFQRRNMQSEVSRLLLALLLNSQTPVAWIGTAQSPDGTADVLEMKTPDGAATRMFIDSMTRLPLMLTWTGPAGRGFGGRGGQGRRGQGAAGGPDQAPAAAPGGAPAAPAGGAAPSGAPPAAPQAPGAAGAGQGGRGRGAQGPPATLEMHLAEYKTVNGIKFPHLITRGASGETNEEWVIKSYKVNPNFKANTFTK